MAICPKCKCEYVDGITECPDCKVSLTESVMGEDDACAFEEAKAILESGLVPELNDSLSESEKQFVINRIKDNLSNPEVTAVKEKLVETAIAERQQLMDEIKEAMEAPVYKSKAGIYENNRSAAGILLFCGIGGLAILLLNTLGVIHLPMTGFSMSLMNAVMGCLFFIFLMAGVRSIVMVKRLKPLVIEEKENIEKAKNFLKEEKAAGKYSLKDYTEKEDDGDAKMSVEAEEDLAAEEALESEFNCSEEAYLKIYDDAVKDIEAKFPEFEPGFAFYVTSEFGAEILDED